MGSMALPHLKFVRSYGFLNQVHCPVTRETYMLNLARLYVLLHNVPAITPLLVVKEPLEVMLAINAVNREEVDIVNLEEGKGFLKVCPEGSSS